MVASTGSGGSWAVVLSFLRDIWAIALSIPRDARALFMFIRLRFAIRKALRNEMIIPKFFKSFVDKHPNKTCLINADTGVVWTFREIDEYSNRIANYFYDAGLRKGDVVAIYMDSKPEYIATWLGLGKIGVVSALINFNIRLQPLAHSLQTSKCVAVIFDTELKDGIAEVTSSLPENMKYFHFGSFDSKFSTALDAGLAKASSGTPPFVDVKMKDELVYIYTSGTTGLPKAAIISNARYVFVSMGIYHSVFFSPDDIHYDPLPLYHSAGGMLGAGLCLVSGITIVIRKKFSASRFWDDCIKYNCTSSQYIGEICRYLLSQPAKPQDRLHKVQRMFGNGLRPQIWQDFADRFGVGHLAELYGATEGNANIVNTDSHCGAVGFLSRLAPFVYPVALIRVDENTGLPIRNKKGLCIRCRPGEPGEFVGKIIQNDPIREFTGYIGKENTNKKIIHDVFSKGDRAFISGDILVMDEYGYVYFLDRTGDTFRWKGENCSTLEVEAVVSNIIGLKDCTVYGVDVQGQEGKAGMAAILDLDRSVDLKELYTSLCKALAPYARPLFIRFVEELPMTGTYKLKKLELQREGFDPSKIKDQMYFLDAGTQQYRELNKQLYNDIISGKARL